MGMKAATPAELEGLLAHAGWLRRFAVALVKDGDEAEDLAQDAMVSAWRHPVEHGGRAWLARVTRNLAVDRYRGHQRRRGREEAAESALERWVSTPEELIGDAEIHRLVAKAVATLPQPFRQTVVLRFYEGQTCADIARSLNAPEGTIRWRLKEGLDRVRRELDARHGDDRSAWVAALTPLMSRPVPGEPAPPIRRPQLPHGWSRPAHLAMAAFGVSVLALAIYGVGARRSRPHAQPVAADSVSAPGEPALPMASRPPVRFNLASQSPTETEDQPRPGPADTEARSLAEDLLQAIADNDYDAFVARGSAFFRAALPTRGFASLSTNLGRRLAQGRQVFTLGSVRRAATIDWMFKIEFDDGDDDALVTLALDGWQVAGFLIDAPNTPHSEN